MNGNKYRKEVNKKFLKDKPALPFNVYYDSYGAMEGVTRA